MLNNGNEIKILGNRIDCFKTYRDLYDHILVDHKGTAIGSRYITVNNVHTVIEGFWNSPYQEIINNSFLSLPDGKPLQIVGRLKGNRTISRLFGPTIMEQFIDWGRHDEFRHFFFGSSEETLYKLKDVIDVRFPGAKVVGLISPPYAPINEWDNQKFIKMINESKPDFIWVGLGAPKQEKWIYTNFRKIDQGILFGIGAGFDYLAGNTKHAPEWMKNASLEWMYRLLQEPRRLWRRYLRTIPQFLILAFLELTGFNLKVVKRNWPNVTDA
jgi:N-acetylglucosaminyldiphosphoundecaprenol N-acetyl-beta-D-mannosaminyltransferase